MKRAAMKILIFPRRVCPFSQHKVPTGAGKKEKEKEGEKGIYNLILQCNLFLRNHRIVASSICRSSSL